MQALNHASPPDPGDRAKSKAASFFPAPGGWESQIPALEQSLLLQAIDEVVTLLDPPPFAFHLPEGLDRVEKAVLAKLEQVLGGEIPPGDSFALTSSFLPVSDGNDLGQPNASLDRLLPVASLDPQTDLEVRELTENQLRLLKANRLDLLAQELKNPRGKGRAIRISWGEEFNWLAGINDVRLAISGRLAQGPNPLIQPPVKGGKTPQSLPFNLRFNLGDGGGETKGNLVLTFYQWLSGWQNSLLQALDRWPAPG